MTNKVDALETKLEQELQEKHFDVRDLNFECDTEEPHFLCSLKIAEA